MTSTYTHAQPLFVFGTLMDVDVLRIVLGRDPGESPWVPATLAGHRLMRVADETYPLLVVDPEASVEGALLADLSRTDWDRIEFFESDEYRFEIRRVVAGGEAVDAWCCGEGHTAGGAGVWTLDWWRKHHKARFLQMIEPYMALCGQTPRVEAEALWSDLQKRYALKRTA